MKILLAFAPFMTFAILTAPLGATGALLAGAVVSAALIVHNHLKARSPKILEIGTFTMFAGLSAYAYLAGSLSIIESKMLVDTGLLAIVLLSMVIGKPFTIQYAKDSVPQNLWGTPQFRHTNYVISAVWALAFLTVVLAEAAMIYWPELSHTAGVIPIVLALVGALKFTSWYPKAAFRAA
jgi:hypothetical protein